MTTIPASALFGVSIGLGEVSVSWEAAGVLGINVFLLLFSGTLTLAFQTLLSRRRQAQAA